MMGEAGRKVRVISCLNLGETDTGSLVVSSTTSHLVEFFDTLTLMIWM